MSKTKTDTTTTITTATAASTAPSTSTTSSTSSTVAASTASSTASLTTSTRASASTSTMKNSPASSSFVAKQAQAKTRLQKSKLEMNKTPDRSKLLLSGSNSNKKSTPTFPSDNNDDYKRNKQLRDLETDLIGNLSSSLKELENKIKTHISETLAQLNDRLFQCESELTEIRRENDKIRDQLEDHQRVQRLSDVIVCGLPNEGNAIDLAKKLAAKLNHNLSPHFDAFRLNTRNLNTNMNKPILIHLSSPAEKRNLLSAFQANGSLTSSQLFDVSGSENANNNPGQRIYINESLSPLNSSLLRHAIKLRREGILFSARTKNGYVYVRKSSDDTEIKIDSSTFSTTSIATTITPSQS